MYKRCNQLSETREELNRHKGQNEFEDFAKQHEILREKLTKQELKLTTELSDNWRLLDAYRELARICQEQKDATAKEVHFYLGRQDWTSDTTFNKTWDLLKRAQERLDHSMKECSMHIEESHKSVARLEYLCGKAN